MGRLPRVGSAGAANPSDTHTADTRTHPPQHGRCGMQTGAVARSSGSAEGLGGGGGKRLGAEGRGKRGGNHELIEGGVSRSGDVVGRGGESGPGDMMRYA